ncbi:hypothetical protein DNTS_027978, partial [Danionella cerebrum]
EKADVFGMERIVEFLFRRKKSKKRGSWKSQSYTLPDSRPLENICIHLNQCQEKEAHLQPLSPLSADLASPQPSSALRTTSTPLPNPTRDSSQAGVSIRKRRRLGASPGGLHWDAT